MRIAIVDDLADERALLREQLGDFFRAELEKAFGPDLRPLALGIDEPFLKTLSLAEGAWEESEVENLRGGRLSRRLLHRRQCAAAPCLTARSAARGL